MKGSRKANVADLAGPRGGCLGSRFVTLPLACSSNLLLEHAIWDRKCGLRAEPPRPGQAEFSLVLRDGSFTGGRQYRIPPLSLHDALPIYDDGFRNTNPPVKPN